MKVLITAGPTIERIDPVRYLTNDSSGKQGYAIAKECINAGWDVTLVSGPTKLAPPSSAHKIEVESAKEMHKACMDTLDTGIDIAICTAAVSDWKPKSPSSQKLKKKKGIDSITIELTKNPDILHDISHHTHRPKLVIGFAAETENLTENAKKKLKTKACDWIIANQVGGTTQTFGGDYNQVHLITSEKSTAFSSMSKKAVAQEIVKNIKQIIDCT